QSSVRALLIASIMRIVLFLAALGVASQGGQLNSDNPASTPFEYAAGSLGLLLFGVGVWAGLFYSSDGAADSFGFVLFGLRPPL
ncbi:hypothetical protein CWI56_03965, partial [Neisseria meningitidis]